MAKKKCWSRTVGAHRGTKVRVYERTPGGNLHLSIWVTGEGEIRRSLRHKDRDLALKEAREIASEKASGELHLTPELTLGTILERYLAENRHAPDGSLKTEAYMGECRKMGSYLVSWFGDTCPVEELTPDRMNGYARTRRAGRINGRKVRTRCVQQELSFLKSMLKWATGIYVDGVPLLDRNPLTGYTAPKERDPKRPMITAQTVSSLLKVTPNVHRLLPLLIVLMDTTGRRLSSVLGIRWDDINFSDKTIRWRAELDKRRKTWLAPMPSAAEAALLLERNRNPQIGSALVFPHPRNRKKPVTTHLSAYWLKEAYRLAGIERPKGSLWHCFRRKWATERKEYPLRDVAAAGGWSDVQTLLTCYQQPDPATMRAVVDAPVQRHGVARLPA